VKVEVLKNGMRWDMAIRVGMREWGGGADSRPSIDIVVKLLVVDSHSLPPRILSSLPRLWSEMAWVENPWDFHVGMFAIPCCATVPSVRFDRWKFALRAVSIGYPYCRLASGNCD